MHLRLNILCTGLLLTLVTPVCAADLRVLFLGDDGPHQPRQRYDQLAPALASRGIVMTYSDSAEDLVTLSSDHFDALVLYANIDVISAAQAKGLLQYVQSGGGFVPLHCASYCFRNNDDIVRLIGAQFLRHGTGVFRTESIAIDHPITRGLDDIESWDETYVHSKHNDAGRTVLQYRVDSAGREPWTWVRTHGDGRVFYTAWGHDDRTWSHPGFRELVERGIRWTCNQELAAPRLNAEDKAFPVPTMTSLPPGEVPFEFVDVGAEIPNYTPSEKWGTQGKPMSTMQAPLEPNESMHRMTIPAGFHLELFVSEPELGGKPIAMSWDARGRLWVAETYDYPNELQPPESGRDRIRICEDTDADGRADRFTVFAEKLSIPTSITFSSDAVIVQNGTETLWLKDNDGDDVADERKTLISGWELGDTHGGVSNFQYGLDNWIWAMQGYNNSQPKSSGVEQERFRMGFFRFRPDGSQVQFIRSTNNNTWGLGISEDGLIFGSTANGNPSVFMPIANRYYEQVRGWAPSLTLSSIAENNDFHPITTNVRQVDHHGGYTAGAGHALYTGRQFPREYWNRVAFVNGPTGHLVGAFVLDRAGSGYRSKNSFNLLASDDQWCAPIMAEVGPDGCVWVIDWYNYIVQHNPTPEGFQTGKGKAYETKLRDKKHGRVYRVVYDGNPIAPTPNLDKATSIQCVAALRHPSMIVRKHAQRLLVERGDESVTDDLVGLVNDQGVDEVGLNVAAIHALWTLDGLGLIGESNPLVHAAVLTALRHPSPGVRRNALEVLPLDSAGSQALVESGLLFDADAQVRLAATLALARLPASDDLAGEVIAVLRNAVGENQIHLRDAATIAAANQSGGFLRAVASQTTTTPSILEVTSIVANHFARGNEYENLDVLLVALTSARSDVAAATINGLLAGQRSAGSIRLTPQTDDAIVALVKKLDGETKSAMIALGLKWGSTQLGDYVAELQKTMLSTIGDESAEIITRVAAARQMVDFQPNDVAAVKAIMEQWTARTDVELATGILAALQRSRAANVGDQVVTRLPMMTPAVRDAAIKLLLNRPDATRSLLTAAKAGTTTIDDLTLDQKQALANHPDKEIAATAKQIFETGGTLPSADRQKVLDDLQFVTAQVGDVARGREVFKKQCAACHIHSGEGNKVGPELTGMAVHPKAELLTHIIDPSRSVEGNFKLYTVVTSDGVVISGTLASESRTAIDLFDAQGKRRAILREDIEQMVASRKSIMPEGFEKQITAPEFVDLLEFLTNRGQYLPIDLAKVATNCSGQSMFTGGDRPVERLLFANWDTKVFNGIPFSLVDPQGDRVANVILLRGPEGSACGDMPTAVSLPCNGPLKAVHLLSGVSGWGHPYGQPKSVSMIVRIHYVDGGVEDHELQNSVHFADYIRRVDVPESDFAFDLAGRQIRYLAIEPRRDSPVANIEFVKGPDQSAPVVMAVTLQSK